MFPDQSDLDSCCNGLKGVEKQVRQNANSSGALTWNEENMGERRDLISEDHNYTHHCYKLAEKDHLKEFAHKIVQPGQNFGSPIGYFLENAVTTINNLGYYSENSQYRTISVIGTGGYATVQKCIDFQSQRELARKQMSTVKFRPEEVEVLLDLGSGEGLNYIPKLFGVSVENQTASLWMEFIDYTWEKLPKLDVETVLPLTTQLLNGVEYLHRHDVVHLDIKPQNIGLTSCGQVKLLDFGSARKSSNVERFKEHLCGVTPEYLPPEVFQADFNCAHIKKVDIWAAGLSSLFLITKQHPWHELASQDDRVAGVVYSLRQATVESICRDLPDEVQNLPWLRDVFLCMFQINPERRCSALIAKGLVESNGNQKLLNQVCRDYLSSFDRPPERNQCLQHQVGEAANAVNPMVAFSEVQVQIVTDFQEMEQQTLQQNICQVRNNARFILGEQQQQVQNSPERFQLLVPPVMLQNALQERLNQLAAAQEAPNLPDSPQQNRADCIPNFNQLLPDEDSL